jgi:putative ABC transport system permease protein
LVMVPMFSDDIHKHFDAVQDELKKAGVVTDMAEATSPTNQVWSTNSGFEWAGKDPGQALDFPNIEVSPEYGRTIGWSFSAGRDFAKGDRSDSLAFVVNEAAVKFMGLKAPVGQIVKWDGQPFRLIGVIKDMIMESPYSPVRPTFYHLASGSSDFVILRIDPRVGMHKALAAIEPVFKKYSQAQPFDVQFSDEAYAQKFGDEQRVGRLTGFFSALAIFISCLGLFGMASFTAEQRTKEIGIRKVLGASVANLWGLLSKDFVVLTGISLLISLPLSFYLMDGWLDKYAYRTSLTWWIFASAAVGAIAVTLVTVSFQAIKAALANPTRSLKTE